MAGLLTSLKFTKKLYCRFYSHYEVPERYRNSFYLANAALFDSVNWFLHQGYEACFQNLVKNLLEKQSKLKENDAVNRVGNIIHLLEQCNSVIDVRFPIKRDNGAWKVIRGFRAQHGLASGYLPSLGGLRINENITRDQMKALCVLSTYKHFCLGIKLSGAYGGIKINPSNYSQNELKTVVENYARELHLKGYCNSDKDVLEPDNNTSSMEMSWIATTSNNATSSNNAVVGKPKSLGGLEKYEKMSSLGTLLALDYFVNDEKIMKELNLEKGLQGKTFIIQGLGKRAISLINYLTNSGALCVGVREYEAHLYDSSGVNIKAITGHKSEFGSIKNLEHVRFGQLDSIFKEECDILVLTAQQNSLTCNVAKHVKAKIVIEASNCAITPMAHKILVGRLKLVLPDIYVTAGSSVASYLEYLLNRKQAGIEDLECGKTIYANVLNALYLKEVPQQIALSSTCQKIASFDIKSNFLPDAVEVVMIETANKLLNLAKDYKLNLDLRTAAYINAIQRIHQSLLTKY